MRHSRTRSSFLVAVGASLAALAQAPSAMAAGQPFVITITNVSTEGTLTLPNGKTISAPTAPGVFAVLSEGTVLFRNGQSAADTALETLAEDGNPEPLIAALSGQAGVKQAGLILPGQAVAITAEPGDRIAFASMFVQSNDLFYAPEPAGLALFSQDGRPFAGEVSGDVMLWDAGTEKNEAPGIGASQAPRQTRPNTGPAENGIVHAVTDGFAYPSTGEVLRIHIVPE